MAVLGLTATHSLVASLPSILLAPVVAQSNSPSPSFPLPNSLPSGTTVKVDGSSSMTVINQALRKRFEQKFPGTKVELASGGTDGALAALLRGDINMAAIGRPLTDKEKGQGLVATPVSREKIAIIVGSDDPFKKNLTFEQFAKMFRGEITNWSQVGGTPGKIRFIDHPEYSDTRRSLSTYAIFKKAPFKNGANTTRLSQDDTATIVQALGKDGISYAIADQVLNLPNVRVLPMHKTMPTDPRYPYSQPRGYVYRKETATPATLAFLGFATSAPGQEILAAAKQQEAEAVRQSITSGSSAAISGSGSATSGSGSGTSVVATGSSPNPASTANVALVPTASEATGQGFPWWWLLLLAGIPLLILLWWLLNRRRRRTTEINNEIVNLVANSPEINKKIESLRNDWNLAFMSLAAQHADELVNTISSREAFNRIIAQKLTNNDADLNRYINQQIDNTYEQKIQNHIPLIAHNIVNNNEELKQYIDRRLQHSLNNSPEINKKIESLRNDWNLVFMSLATEHADELVNTISSRETFNRIISQKLVNNDADLNRYINQQIDNIYEQKSQNHIPLIARNIVNNNEELKQYIDRRLQDSVNNSPEINNKIVNLVANSPEINKKIESLRNDWNRTFITLVTQHVDERMNTIGSRETFNRLITQKLINNNAEFNQYISQQIDNTYEQKIQHHIPLIAHNIVNNNEELKQYIDRRLQDSVNNSPEINNKIVNLVANSPEINKKIESLRNDWNRTFITLVTQHVDERMNTIGSRETFNRLITQKLINNNAEFNQYISQQIDNTYEQKIQHHIPLIAHNIVNNNEELKQYIDRRLQDSVNNSPEINNKIVNLVANSPEINKKIESLRNDWNRTFIDLVTQHVDEMINTIGDQETFNRVISQKLVNNNTDLNHYISQQIDNIYDQKLQHHIPLITHNIVNNNEELNQYIDRRLQHRVNNTEVNNEIVNLVANSPEINNKIENLRNDWNRTFIDLVTQHVDELINTIGDQETFNRVISQKLVNNNTDLNHYISQQIDNIYDQKLQHHIPLITHNIVNNNEELNQYIDRRLQHRVNNTEVNNEIVNLVANSPEINNKIENLRNDWNRTFIDLVTQHVDEMINTIGDQETFNRVISQKLVNNNTDLKYYISQQIENIYDQKIQNEISVMIQNISQEIDNTHINQIITTKNELIVLMNSADRQLYEWILGELMAIKGCLTDRETLVETLVTLTTELRTKLDRTACVDIKTFKPFKPVLELNQ
ncbi:substrate-binding domain-containing protein [Brasilonema sennae]|nr:substrate-binding domain-containing protein [Brasilonema sennae]